MGVGKVIGLHDDPDLAPCLDGIGLLYALEGIGYLLKLLKPLQVAFEGLAPYAGPACRERIGRRHEHGFDGLRLAVPVMGQDRIDHLRRFAVLLGKIAADGRMRPLHFVVYGLAQVMQEACAPRELLVHAQLRRHDAGEVGDLTGMHQYVLPVARPVPQPPDQLDDLRVDVMDPEVEDGLLAFLLHGDVQVLSDLVSELLDARRMDPAVMDQPFDGLLGDLPAQRVVAREDHRLGRIIDDQIDARCGLKRPDVPAFAADDPALHLVVRQVHHGHGGLRHVIAGVPLDGGAHDALGLLVGLFPGLVLDPLDRLGGLILCFVLHGDHQLPLCLFGSHAGDLLEQLALLTQARFILLFLLLGVLLAARKLPLAPLGLGLPLLDGVELLLQALFLLGQLPLLVLKLRALVARLFIEIRTGLVKLVLCLELRLFQLGLGLALRVRQHPGRLLLGVADLAGSDPPFDQQADAKACGDPYDHKYDIFKHLLLSSCILSFQPCKAFLDAFFFTLFCGPVILPLLREVLLFDEMVRVVVGIFIALSSAEPCRAPVMGVPEMAGHGKEPACFNVLHCRADGNVAGIALRSRGNVGRCLGKGDPPLRHADALNGLVCGNSSGEGPRVRIAHVLARRDHDPPGDKERVLSRSDHFCQPVYRCIGIASTHALDERGDRVIMLVLVIDKGLFLDRLLSCPEIKDEPAPCARRRRQDAELKRVQRAPGIASRSRHEMRESFRGQFDLQRPESPVLVPQGPQQERADILVAQRLELEDL